MSLTRPGNYPYPRDLKEVKDVEDYIKKLYASLIENDRTGDFLRDRATDIDLKALIVRPEWYGAKGDGVKDDTAAIQAAITAATSSGKRVHAVGTYLISDTIDITCSADLWLSTFNIAATTAIPAIRIGNQSATTVNYLEIKLPKLVNTAKPETGWTGVDTSIGVEINTAQDNRIYNRHISGFGYGMVAAGYSGGCVHNEIHLGNLWDNKINLRLRPANLAGWTNENLFIGGQLTYSSHEGIKASGTKDIEISNISGGHPCNNNVFLKPSCEGDSPEYQLWIQGQHNRFISPRLEVGAGYGGDPTIHFYSETTETQGNIIEAGYSAHNYDVTMDGTCQYNRISGTLKSDALAFNGGGIAIANHYSDSDAYPHIQGFPGAINPIEEGQASTTWVYRLHGDGISVKHTGSSYAHFFLGAASGKLYMGTGAAAPVAYIFGSGNNIFVEGNMFPPSGNSWDLGEATTYTWKDLHLAGTGYMAGAKIGASGSVTAGLNWGATASVADGGTITHGAGATPTAVIATCSVSGESVAVTAIGSTTFTVAIKKSTDGSAGTSQTIYWMTLK